MIASLTILYLGVAAGASGVGGFLLGYYLASRGE